MSLLFSSLFNFLTGGNPWGLARLPDGRGIFFPWLTSVYLVPSDEIYHRIRRKMFLWEIIFLPVGFGLGPAVLVFSLKYFGLGDVTLFLWSIGVFISLFSMIFIYVRWATKITRNLELYTGQDLYPTKATSYPESKKWTVALFSMSFLYCAALSCIVLSIMAVFILVVIEWNWLAVFLLVMSLGSLVSCIIDIRRKRKMPKQDFFK